MDNHVKNKKYGNFVSISSLTGEYAAEIFLNFCSSSLWTSLHHMVILKSQNKITDFLMILAWASPFKMFSVMPAGPGLYRSYAQYREPRFLPFNKYLVTINFIFFSSIQLAKLYGAYFCRSVGKKYFTSSDPFFAMYS